MPNKKATLLGATGLIGGHLLELLKNDEAFTEIKILVRRKIRYQSSKSKASGYRF